MEVTDSCFQDYLIRNRTRNDQKFFFKFFPKTYNKSRCLNLVKKKLQKNTFMDKDK